MIDWDSFWKWTLAGVTAVSSFGACSFYYLAEHWKKKAAAAFLVVGQRGESKEEREWGYRNALIAEHEKAEKFYYYSALEKFNDEKPMEAYMMEICGKMVPCVFADYYIPSRDASYISKEQTNFCNRIYRFKSGADPCIDLLTKALGVLGYSNKTTIIFMPCSSESRYKDRFRKVYKELTYYGFNVVYYSVKYMYERKSKHMAIDRSKVETDVHVVPYADVVGRKVIIIDDVITTGTSIKQHAEELRPFGVEVIGVVCLGHTVMYPGNEAVRKQAKRDEDK